MTIKRDLTIEQYATFCHGFGVATKAKRVVQLTGYSALLQVRNPRDGQLLLELSTENGGISIDAESGRINLEISHEATGAISWSSGVFDLLLIAPNGFRDRLVEGAVRVKEGVTREGA